MKLKCVKKNLDGLENIVVRFFTIVEYYNDKLRSGVHKLTKVNVNGKTEYSNIDHIE